MSHHLPTELLRSMALIKWHRSQFSNLIVSSDYPLHLFPAIRQLGRFNKYPESVRPLTNVSHQDLFIASNVTFSSRAKVTEVGTKTHRDKKVTRKKDFLKSTPWTSHGDIGQHVRYGVVLSATMFKCLLPLLVLRSKFSCKLAVESCI